MENIDSELLLNFYFKDGYMFSCPDRLLWEDLDNIDFDHLELGDENLEDDN